MKIYFCDLCNESIPQEDLEQNRVTSVRGKMICAKCVPTITAPAGAAAAPAPAAAASSGARSVTILALVVALGGLYLAWDAKGRLDRQTDPAPRLMALEQSLGQLRDQATRLETLAHDSGESLAKLGAEPSKLREELAAQLARVEGIERDVGKIDNLLVNLRSDKEEFEAFQIKQKGLEQTLGELRTEIAGLHGKVAALGSAPPAAAPAAAPAAPAPADPAAALDADTKKLLADFNSKDGAVRWSAVDRIAKRHDPTLLSYLMPMLDDADAFVQFRAISAMRELNAKSSVGRLIKLLRDGDAIVRSEAQDALNTLTGNPQRFDLDNGSPADREKCVKAWEEWYEKNKARFEEPTAAAPAPPAKG